MSFERAHLEALLYNTDRKLDRLLKLAAFQLMVSDALCFSVESRARAFFNLDGVLGAPEDVPHEFRKLTSKRKAESLDAASRWFCDLDAFSEADRALVQTTVERRNKAAHELLPSLLDHDSTAFSEAYIEEALDLINRLDVWGLRHVERDWNPLFPKGVTDDALGHSQTGIEILLRQLFAVAFPQRHEEERAA